MSLGLVSSLLLATYTVTTLSSSSSSSSAIITFAAAACSDTTCSNTPTSQCTLDHFAKNSRTATQDTTMQCCLATGGGSCRIDPCQSHYDADTCANDKACIGGGYMSFSCVSKEKICASFSYNATICELSFFCKSDALTGACSFSPPEPGAAGPSSTADCPALHPFVVFLIIAIFITFVLSIIMIVWKMLQIKKEAEEEEKAEEERQAEADISRTRRAQSSVERESTINKSNNRGQAQPSAATAYAPAAAAPAAAAAAPAADTSYATTNNGGYDASANAAGAEAFEIQYDEYGGYYDANGTYWDAQGNAYGADGQPISTAAGGGDVDFNEDDY